MIDNGFTYHNKIPFSNEIHHILMEYCLLFYIYMNTDREEKRLFDTQGALLNPLIH